MSLTDAVVAHYGRGDLLLRIETALRESGKDPEHPTIDDLAGVDEFIAKSAIRSKIVPAIARMFNQPTGNR